MHPNVLENNSINGKMYLPSKSHKAERRVVHMSPLKKVLLAIIVLLILYLIFPVPCC